MSMKNDRTLTIEKVVEFLKRESWRQLSTKDEFEMYAFETPKSFGVLGRVFLPKFAPSFDQRLQEYQEEILIILENLSFIYKVPVEALAERIRNYASYTDTILLRLNPGEEVDSISYSTFQSAIENVGELLAYAACAEIEEEPRQYYPRILQKGGIFRDTCRFGHTFRGSYGLKITFPIKGHQISIHDPDNDYACIRKEIPLERRALERTISGLLKVKEATIHGSCEIITNTYKTGMNANMCGALESILLQAEVPEISWNFELDQTLPALPEIRHLLSDSVNVRKESIKVIREAREMMTPEKEKKTTTITGHVIELRARNPKDKETTRVIKIESDSVPHAPRFVYLELQPDDYASALRAHGEHKSVTASGTLEPLGQRSFWLRVNSPIILEM